LLRVGILVDSKINSAWIADIINEINRTENIHLAILVHNRNISIRSMKLGYNVFRKIDQTFLPGKPNLLTSVNLNLVKDVPSLIATPLKKGQETYYSAKDLEEIKNTKPDLLLHFDSGILQGEILTLCKFGVWCIYAGGISFSDRSVGFWEWYHKTPITKISLLQLGIQPKENGCLWSGVTKTEYLSLSRNQTAVFSKGIDMLIGLLDRYSTSEIQIQPTNNPLNEVLFSNEPGFWASLFAVGKLTSRVVTKFFTKAFFIEQWVIFFSFTSPRIPQLDFGDFKALMPPKDHIWADPFVVTENHKHYIFIEELSTKTNKGHISCLVLNNNGEVETSNIIINQPFHLSYPFIFRHEGTWFMVPESADNLTVDLYECLEFPFKWKFRKSLLTNVRAFDATLHFQDEKFWLFCTIQKRLGASTNEDLYIFSSHDLLEGEWKSHPGNPVLSDPASARPAGKIFFHNNSWYRPSQICVPRYGYGLSLNKIIKLSESSYTEENVSHALPNWKKDLLSVHTLNFTEGITVIDGQLKRIKI